MSLSAPMAWARLLALLLTAGLVAQAGSLQPQQIYRWKDAKGRQHVTNSPPPPGAVPLDVPPLQNPQSPTPPGTAASPSALETASGSRSAQAPVPPEWQGFSERLEAARKARNADAAANQADAMLDDALWGGVSKALPLLPVATFALVVLLGWWIGGGLRRGPASVVMASSILAGLALAQFTLSSFLYQSQFARVQARLTALEGHLGSGRTWKSENRARLKIFLRSLESKASPLSAPWDFPKELQALREFLPQALLDP